MKYVYGFLAAKWLCQAYGRDDAYMLDLFIKRKDNITSHTLLFMESQITSEPAAVVLGCPCYVRA